MEESDENFSTNNNDENKENQMSHSHLEYTKAEHCQREPQEGTSLFSTTFNLNPSDVQNSFFSHHSSLFRTLYLRREFRLINELRWDMMQQSPCRNTNTKSDNNTNSITNNVILLPFSHMPPSQESCNNNNNKYTHRKTKRQGNYFEERERNQKEEEEYWYGLIIVNDKSSPWYEGVFPFLVHFPLSYPFACPRIELTGAFPSHPWVVTTTTTIDDDNNNEEVESEQELKLEQQQETSQQNRSCNHYIIPFEHIYNQIDPMKTSVMSALCAYMSDFFSFANQANPLQHRTNKNNNESQKQINNTSVVIDRALARHDVQRRSITQEIILGNSYVHFVENVMTPFFLQQGNANVNHSQQCHTFSNSSKSDKLVNNMFVTDQLTESTFARWYTNVVLPQLHQMQ